MQSTHLPQRLRVARSVSGAKSGGGQDLRQEEPRAAVFGQKVRILSDPTQSRALGPFAFEHRLKFDRGNRFGSGHRFIEKANELGEPPAQDVVIVFSHA
jgi:hypothetical protein